LNEEKGERIQILSNNFFLPKPIEYYEELCQNVKVVPFFYIDYYDIKSIPVIDIDLFRKLFMVIINGSLDLYHDTLSEVDEKIYVSKSLKNVMDINNGNIPIIKGSLMKTVMNNEYKTELNTNAELVTIANYFKTKEEVVRSVSNNMNVTINNICKIVEDIDKGFSLFQCKDTVGGNEVFLGDQNQLTFETYYKASLCAIYILNIYFKLSVEYLIGIVSNFIIVGNRTDTYRDILLSIDENGGE
jgi:hypothetical protein